ncbi:MAG TPA: hypothetical protein VJ848_07950, partial [Candidatus Angelobacter sp.]|nr:hypothetical protein [Candidatus Angelobacter sp.]
LVFGLLRRFKFQGGLSLLHSAADLCFMKKLYFAAIREINLRMSRESALKIKGKIKVALDCAADLSGWAQETGLLLALQGPSHSFV